jgi:hypothetical protein
MGYFGSLCTPEPRYIALINQIFTPTQAEIDFWGRSLLSKGSMTRTSKSTASGLFGTNPHGAGCA